MINKLYDGANSREDPKILTYGSTLTRELGDKIRARFPAVDFAIWDLEEFYSAFHNVRRNIVFIECDKIIHDSLVRLISSDEIGRSCAIYVGERKPKIINELVRFPAAGSGNARSSGEGSGGRYDLSSTGTIVIVHRTDFENCKPVEPFEGDKHENKWSPYFTPCRERKLVDLLAYALRGWIPVQVSEAIDAIKWSFENRKINVGVLHNYATRRYLGWFMAVLLYKLSKKKAIVNIDPRYVENGAKYLEALNELNEL